MTSITYVRGPGDPVRLLEDCPAVDASYGEGATHGDGVDEKDLFFFLNVASVPINTGATVDQRCRNIFKQARKAPEYQDCIISTKPMNPIQRLG